MKLNSKSRYAVMALADIASFDKNKPVSLRDISLRQNISLVFLEQIFSKLKKNNIVKSIRGTNGGYVYLMILARLNYLVFFWQWTKKLNKFNVKKNQKKDATASLQNVLRTMFGTSLNYILMIFLIKKILVTFLKKI